MAINPFIYYSTKMPNRDTTLPRVNAGWIENRMAQKCVLG